MEDKVARTGKKDKTLMLAVCHLLQLIQSMAIWVQFSVLPARIQKLGADPVVFGYMGTVGAVCVLVGGPAFGLFADKFGPRPSLIAAYFSDTMKYSIVAMGNSIPMLFVSRLFGVASHPRQGIQMVASGVSEEHEKTGALGKLRLTGGIGMVLGPVVGGFIISHTSEEYAAGVSAVMSLLGVLIAIATIPPLTRGATREAEAGPKDNKTPDRNGVLRVEPVLSLLRMPVMLQILAQRTAADVSFDLWHTVLVLVGTGAGRSAQELGTTISLFGLAAMLFQGLAVGPICRKFSDRSVLKWSLVGLSGAYLSMVILPLSSFLFSLQTTTSPHPLQTSPMHPTSQPQAIFGTYAVAAIIIVSVSMLLNIVLDGATTKRVPDTLVGTALGLSTATNCFSKAICPSVGAYLYSAFGSPSASVMGFMLCGAVALINGVSSSVTPN